MASSRAIKKLKREDSHLSNYEPMAERAPSVEREEAPTVARILGVPVERMILYTFLINAALAAMASLLVSPIYLAKFSNGETLGLVAFVAAIVGGFNQVRGAIAGGLLIGVLDNLAAAYVSTAYRQAIPLILLVLIILFRPQGLLGRREERAV